MKENQAARFADLLESIVRKARALTIDRMAGAITRTALGLGAAVLVVMAMVLISIGLFRLLIAGVGATAAYAVFGGLFLVAGWLSWRKRIHVPEEPNG